MQSPIQIEALAKCNAAVAYDATKTQLTPAEKKRRREQYMVIFINGRQKRVKRPPTIDGMSEEEFLRRRDDPMLLHQLRGAGSDRGPTK